MIASRNRSLVGIRGKIIFETKNVFYIIANGRIKIVPKAGTIFVITDIKAHRTWIFDGEFLRVRWSKLRKLHRRRYY